MAHLSRRKVIELLEETFTAQELHDICNSQLLREVYYAGSTLRIKGIGEHQLQVITQRLNLLHNYTIALREIRRPKECHNNYC